MDVQTKLTKCLTLCEFVCKIRQALYLIQVSHPSFPTTDLTDLLRALVGLRPLGIPKGDACYWKDARNLTDSSCAWAFNYTGFSKITAAKAAIAFHKLAGKSL